MKKIIKNKIEKQRNKRKRDKKNKIFERKDENDGGKRRCKRIYMEEKGNKGKEIKEK